MKIGGDIGGLHALARTLTGAAPQVGEIGDYLFTRVDALVHDAGWKGDAAEAFKGAWEQDGAAVDELSEVMQLAGAAVETLAGSLSSAQDQLDAAVETATRAGVHFTDDGPVDDFYTGAALAAATRFHSDESAATAAADAARQQAAQTLYALLSAVNPQVAADGGDTLGIADLAGLGAALKGYYVVPNARVEELEADIAAAKSNYRTQRAKWKNSAPGSDARKDLSAELKELRAERTELAADLEGAESLSGHFKGGNFLDSSVGDTFRALGGELEADSKLGRLLDGVPALDVALAGVATWAQMKDDHDKGWSWTHALIADGGANAAALGAGVASDLIPVVGPFISPVVGYGVGAIVTEATHEGHWTEHVEQDGWALGVAEGVGDTGKAVWNNDVVGMGSKIGYDASHPGQAVSGLWSEAKSLF